MVYRKSSARQLVDRSRCKLESTPDSERAALFRAARAAGEVLYGASHTGLVMGDDFVTMTWAEYAASTDNTVDTYDFVFYHDGHGVDAADGPLKPEHVDSDGKIYLGGSNGVLVLTDPFVEHPAPGIQWDKNEESKWRKTVLKDWPDAQFDPPNRWGKIYARSGDRIAGTFYTKDDNDWIKANDWQVLGTGEGWSPGYCTWGDRPAKKVKEGHAALESLVRELLDN